MSKAREKIFWNLIEALDLSCLLPHVMIVGSWAEYLYPYYFEAEFDPHLRTRDIDVYYGNPYLEVPGAETLRTNLRTLGFLTGDDYGSQGRFYKEGIEVEFLSSQLGSGPGIVEIPFTGVFAEKLDAMDMLRPIAIEANGYSIKIPTPASYVAHKLFINVHRRTQQKQQKDIEAIRSLLLFMHSRPNEMQKLNELLDGLPEEKRRVIEGVAKDNAIRLE